MLFKDQAWTDLKKSCIDETVVIVPLGSTEQHGPHLPVWTDSCIAEKIAYAVGQKAGALVAPTINYGYSDVWHDYPGTISLSSTTLRAVMHDVCASLIRTGFKKIVILNGHNPNQIIIQPLAYDLVNEFSSEEITIAAATYIFMAKEECENIGEYFRDGSHANEAETSLMLYLFPDLVKMDRVSDMVETFAQRRLIVYEGSAVIVNKWPSSAMYSGVYGSPSLATMEKGKAYFDILVEKISQFIVDFREGKLDAATQTGLPIIRN